MYKIKIKKDDADAFKKIAKEDLETIICTSIDLLEETFILIGYDTEGMVFDKDNIDDLFRVIKSKNAEYTYYINENKQEIKIEYVDNSQLILVNIG